MVPWRGLTLSTQLYLWIISRSGKCPVATRSSGTVGRGE